MSTEAFGQVVATLTEQIETEANNYEKTNRKTKTSYRLSDSRFQVERLRGALENCVEKIRFALLLPTVVADEAELGQFFRARDEAKFREEWNAALGGSVSGANADELRLTGKWLQDLNEDALRKCIDSAFEMRTRRETHAEGCSGDARMILGMLSDLKCIGEHKVCLTAAQALGKEKTLHRVWIDCERMSREINARRKEIEAEGETTAGAVCERRRDIDYSEMELKNLSGQIAREFNAKM